MTISMLAGTRASRPIRLQRRSAIVTREMVTREIVTGEVAAHYAATHQAASSIIALSSG